MTLALRPPSAPATGVPLQARRERPLRHVRNRGRGASARGPRRPDLAPCAVRAPLPRLRGKAAAEARPPAPAATTASRRPA